ncbi:HD domain-containing protein [Myxococcota bacterium]|nr:HD domain-containing protein [Myxococcota bacterium]MBU1537340.1 HD domain-containing protein [Myxococcota bacterium]
MSPFFSPTERANELRPVIKDLVWEIWAHHWPETSIREKYISALVRSSSTLFTFIWRSWPNSEDILNDVEKALLFAIKAHASQSPRKTGEPYVMHPINVASSCAENGLDSTGIIAALLHDILEDTDTSRDELTQMFGLDVSEIVEGLSKVKSKDKAMIDRDKVLTFLKILGPDKSDNLLRTILIKILDRRDNMKTIDVFRDEKQRRYGQETIYIYSSLANILGMRLIASELVSKSIKPFFPDQFDAVHKRCDLRQKSYITEAAFLQDTIRKAVADRISVKFLHFYPTLTDYLDRDKERLKITSPPLKLRLRVPTIIDMYTVLGYVHTAGLSPSSPTHKNSMEGISVVSESWKDYVVSPLANGYRAITTTIVFHKETWLLEIVSQETEGIVDWGILSDFKNESLRRFYYTSLMAFVNNISNIENMRYTDLQSITSSAVADIQVRLGSGSFIRLPKGSTVIDLAYLVDSDVGLYCNGALVNGQHQSVEYVLSHGEAVELQTTDTPRVRQSYFQIMKSRKALANYQETVRAYYNRIAYETGKKLLFEFVSLYKVPDVVFQENEETQLICSPEEIIDVGLCRVSVTQVLESHGIVVPTEGFFAQRSIVLPRVVDDLHNLMYAYPDCCNIFPLVDEDVVMQHVPENHQSIGVIHLHNKSCPNLDMNRTIIPVRWQIKLPSEVPLRIAVEDSIGLAGKITGIVAKNHLNILSLSADSRAGDPHRYVNLTLELRQDDNWKIDENRFINCLRMLRKLKEVRRIDTSME